jgi:dephospho-CoA kinase
VFADAVERKRLEELVHPRVSALREARTAEARARVPAPRAVVWDIPLLVEVGLAGMCQRLVFVETPEEVRVARAAARNGWTREELLRRQAAQLPLEAKKAMAHDVLDGLAGETEAKAAVERVLKAVG